jgi:hypothetical protein
MPYDGGARENGGLAAEVERVLTGGARLSINDLYGLIEEVERSARFYPGGQMRAHAVVGELYRRAVLLINGAGAGGS